MSINLIIASYAGKINKYDFNNEKNNYLKYNIKILDDLNLKLDKITIMKPKINKEHIEINDYYNFENLKNLKNKIKIIECENLGISYGQLFNALNIDLNYDYNIFIEDDYIFYNKDALIDLINEYKKYEKDSLLCSFIYKNKKWNLTNHSIKLKENNNIINLIKKKLNKNNINLKKSYNIPDFSLCILSKYTMEKILQRFTFSDIFDLFNISFNSIWLYQILFGLILFEADIKLYDLENHLNIFYNTKQNNISICHNNNNISIENLNIKKLNLPIFIPLDVLIFKNLEKDMLLISNFCNNKKLFIENYNNKIMF